MSTHTTPELGPESLDAARIVVRQLSATNDLIEGLHAQRQTLALQLRAETDMSWPAIAKEAGVSQFALIEWAKREGVLEQLRGRGRGSNTPADHPSLDRLREVVAQLDTLHHIATDLREQRRVVLNEAYEAGWTMPGLGRELGVSFETAAKWMGRRRRRTGVVA